MPLSPDSIGSTGEPFVHEIDARWVMSYATGIGDTLPCYLDTLRPEGVSAHPLFPSHGSDSVAPSDTRRRCGPF